MHSKDDNKNHNNNKIFVYRLYYRLQYRQTDLPRTTLHREWGEDIFGECNTWKNTCWNKRCGLIDRNVNRHQTICRQVRIDDWVWQHMTTHRWSATRVVNKLNKTSSDMSEAVAAAGDCIDHWRWRPHETCYTFLHVGNVKKSSKTSKTSNKWGVSLS